MGPFLPLFSVEIEHAYFPDGMCRGLRLSATPATMARLDRTDCLLRLTDRGLVVLFDASRVDALRLHADMPDAPLRFDFIARSADPQFANYTEAPVGSADSLLMFDNREAHADDNAGRWRLHAGPSAGTAEWRPLDAALVAEALSAQERRAPPAFAIAVTVSRADVDAALTQGKRYHARLPSRATVWKYCLFGDWVEGQRSADVQVVDPTQAFMFDAAVDEQLPDGRRLLAVRSTTPIALLERSDRRFQLRRRGNGSDKVLVKRLPEASPRQLYRETLGGVPTLVSEIYVHR